jgi:hypothetical protein
VRRPFRANVCEMIDGGAERAHGVGAFHPMYGSGGHEAVTEQNVSDKKFLSVFGQSGLTRFESVEEFT